MIFCIHELFWICERFFKLTNIFLNWKKIKSMIYIFFHKSKGKSVYHLDTCVPWLKKEDTWERTGWTLVIWVSREWEMISRFSGRLTIPILWSARIANRRWERQLGATGAYSPVGAAGARRGSVVGRASKEKKQWK